MSEAARARALGARARREGRESIPVIDLHLAMLLRERRKRKISWLDDGPIYLAWMDGWRNA